MLEGEEGVWVQGRVKWTLLKNWKKISDSGFKNR